MDLCEKVLDSCDRITCLAAAVFIEQEKGKQSFETLCSTFSNLRKVIAFLLHLFICPCLYYFFFHFYCCFGSYNGFPC